MRYFAHFQESDATSEAWTAGSKEKKRRLDQQVIF
jgi:hypothetical protein